jgi:hypothetical protein
MKMRLFVIALALLGAFAPLPESFVESRYSTGVYLSIQPALTGLSNRVPFALFDGLIVTTLAAWVLAVAVDWYRGRVGWGRLVVRVFVRSVVWASVLYVAFLALWGLNYRRVPLTRKVAFDAARVSPAHAQALLAVTVDKINALYAPGHREGWAGAVRDSGLTGGFASAIRRVGVSRLVEPGRPKFTILQWYFRRAAVEGMTDPYFLETLVNADLLPFERPLVVAHEWAHLAGFADEGEANFIGWLACLESSAADQYSGWLFLYGETARAVPRPTRDREASRLAGGPRADLQAIADRLRRETNPRLSAAGWEVYDRYLRANRVEAGAASYAQVVQLILGTGSAGV